MGYPDGAPDLRDRLPLDGLIHREVYQEYSDARIRDVYREREIKGWKRYMTFPRLRKMVEESGVKNLAQLYTTVKYSRESHQGYSKTILEYLRDQDFMN